MVFVNTDERAQELGAAFQQNSLQRVKAGDEAEVAFDAVPSRVFKGKVRLVLDAIAAGQIQATGVLVVSLLRKILLRMRSWQNYVFLEGH
jgi:multidrug resistance efflux pump